MSNHPVNLALRFMLELAMLAAVVVWGWRQQLDWLRFLLGIGLPLLMAFLWGTFRMPNDPGKAPVAVHGSIRLLLELIMFGFAVWALWNTGFPTLAWVFGGVVLFHYIISFDRVIRMLANRP